MQHRATAIGRSVYRLVGCGFARTPISTIHSEGLAVEFGGNGRCRKFVFCNINHCNVALPASELPAFCRPRPGYNKCKMTSLLSWAAGVKECDEFSAGHKATCRLCNGTWKAVGHLQEVNWDLAVIGCRYPSHRDANDHRPRISRSQSEFLSWGD